MSNPSNIVCPNCKHEFPIGNALTQQIETDIRNKYLKVLADDKQKLEVERTHLNKLMEQAKTDAENQEKIIADKVRMQKAILEEEAIKKAASEMNLQMNLLNKQLTEKEQKLK